MPRKKTTPTVATTEPDTSLRQTEPRAWTELRKMTHVAAVEAGLIDDVTDLPISAADLIRASLPRDTPPEEVIRVARFYDELKATGETMPILTGKTFRSVEDLTLYLSQTDRSEVADLPHAPRIVVDTLPEGPPATVARVMREVPTSGDSLRDYLRMSADPTVSPDVGGEYFRRMSKADQVLTNAFVERVCASEAKMVDPILAAKDERIALMDVERANHRKEIEMWMNAVQKVTAERDERDARIAELEAELGAYRTAPASPPISDPATWPRFIPSPGQVPGAPGLVGSSHDYTTWDGSDESMAAYRDSLPEDERDRMDAVALHQGNFGPDDVKRAWRAAIAQRDPGRVIAARDARISNLESTIVENQSILNRIGRDLIAAQGPRPLTPADLIAGYRAVASGQVKAAEWKGRRLVRLHGNPEPIAMYDHPEPPPGCMPSGFVAEVASGTTRIMSPPLKDEAEARAWCEARCGWTVVQ